jgi:hypothetical protein
VSDIGTPLSEYSDFIITGIAVLNKGKTKKRKIFDAFLPLQAETFVKVYLHPCN